MAETILQILQWVVPSGGIGAAIAWVANRRLHAVRAKKQVEDTYKQMYDLVSTELVGLQKQNQMNYGKIEELRTENDKTRRALNRLSRAIEAIQLCPHRLNCPVSGELSLDEESIAAKQQSAKSTTSRTFAGDSDRNDSESRENSHVERKPKTQVRLTSGAPLRGKLLRTKGTSSNKGVS